MITLTFAGDEAGDVSFAFERGASRYFVVAVIATPDPDALRQTLVEIRESARLPLNFEFHFHGLTSSRLRSQVLEALAVAPFESWALVVDKTTLSDSLKLVSRLDFYLYFVTELIRLIPPAKREGATLILDEFGSADTVRSELRHVLDIRSIPGHFKRVLIKRSRSESLIQVADMVAGAILRRDSKNDAGAFEVLSPKIHRVFEYRG